MNANLLAKRIETLAASFAEADEPDVREPNGDEAKELLGWLVGSIEGNRQGPEGTSPPSWVADESKWARAKEAASKGGRYSGSTFWAVVVKIYKNMNGTIK